MALCWNEIQVTWSSNPSIDLVMYSGQTSDEINPSAAAVQSQIQLKADHSGTPGSDDVVEFWLLQTLGDPDGAGGDEYDTDEQAHLLAVLNTYEDDPALTTVPLPLPQKNARLLAKNLSFSTITVCATVLEQVST